MSKVMSAIDGSRAVRAHGDREMPVWGEIFRKEADPEKYTELTSLLRSNLSPSMCDTAAITDDFQIR